MINTHQMQAYNQSLLTIVNFSAMSFPSSIDTGHFALQLHIQFTDIGDLAHQELDSIFTFQILTFFCEKEKYTRYETFYFFTLVFCYEVKNPAYFSSFYILFSENN
jgi:hypothetical protein